ncbi:MAG: ribonuclease HI family protein, partial [Planctomycetes bacterium]|nr:ribonuclease HI family protein [Planctomycetota bacterium]
MIEAYFDGLCEPNPGGVATYGFVVRRDGKKIHEGHGLAGTPKTPQATNNVAEYTGLIKALEWLASQKTAGSIVVRGDSDLIIKQVKGEYKVKSGLLAPLHRKVQDLAAKLPDVSFEWIRRELNADADRLTNLAYAEYTGQAMKAPTAGIMTVDLVIAAPPDQVTQALRKAGLKGNVAAVPGASRVQVDLP